MTKREIICEMGYEEAVVFDSPDYDEAIIGVTEDGRVVYDYDTMVESLQDRDGMTDQEAIEFIDFNTIRAIPYAGAHAPIVMFRITEE